MYDYTIKYDHIQEFKFIAIVSLLTAIRHLNYSTSCMYN